MESPDSAAATTTAAVTETPDKNVPPKKSKARLLQGQSMDAGSSKDDEEKCASLPDVKASVNPVGRPRKSQSSQEEALAPSSNPGMEDIKSEQKSLQKPGKYVCDYCGRACAKPSVLKKHVRSHTGERPYPCVPCGFSFKTKSNLYKHRKSHAHSVKAGTLAEMGTFSASSEHGSFDGEFSDGDQTTDTDDDGGSDPLLLLDTDGSDNTAVKVLNLIAQKKGTTMPSAAHEHHETNLSSPTLEPGRAVPSSAVKQRLALRLSEKRSSDSEHNLSLPSQSSKGSTDSGYFSRSESSEHQTGPPNTNAKSYQEIMFGKCYRPSPKQAYTSKDSERCVSRVYTQEKDISESIKINTKSFTREEIKEPQMDSLDMGLLMRSNSMPTSSAVCLPTPQALRGSHSFDERTSAGGSRRLRRQAAFELSAHESHVDETHGKLGETAPETEKHPSVSAHLSYHRQALELATRKRRKEKREDEELPVRYESEEVVYEAKGRATCEMDVTLSAEIATRKTLGNVISVIQHTNSLNRIQMEQEHYKYQHYHAMETGEGYEMERSDSRLRQSFQMGPKLVRQPNIQVPEIRVTVEPDSPEKAPEIKVKEPEKHVVVEEFQWPQRSETLAQFPPEKLPPKKKRLRLAELEHSSGESSFESACTSLSRSPSQDSNLSYSSTFSFDREDSMRSPGRQDEFGKELLAVPGSSGQHSLSLLHQRQQHEMRRSSSEQAPCNLRKELPEVRSVSFDYGSLSPTSKLKLADYAKGDKRRANLVWQESLNMETESTHQISHHFLTQSLPIFSTGSAFPHLPHPSLLVPVRLQTDVPSFGSLTYTTVSQVFDNQSESISLCSPNLQTLRNLDHTRAASGQTIEALDLSSAKLKTGIPLSLTSRTISTTNASSGGASKRMLSPASSLDLFMEVKQQKRVKEERMFGEIAEELSAVELGNVSEDKMIRRTMEDRSSESPMDSGAMDISAMPTGDAKEDRFAMEVVAKLVTTADVTVIDREHTKILRQFPSLRTTTGVSWCYLNYTKPSCSQNAGPPFQSVYALWCVGAHNPNPPDLSTGAALALHRSKQKGGAVVYSAAQMCAPGAGKLVSSLLLWRHTLEQLQRKPEPRPDTEASAYGKKPKDVRPKAGKDEWKEAPGQSAPTRIKIFEGGYKSNEDYVYVRGRGRGKYICEECGIRCKKPSMLKKHIRTHTDVRPYVCKVCNFAFKTKGNLTKHMKSKAHMKKCLELGVSVSVDDAEIQEQEHSVPCVSSGRRSPGVKVGGGGCETPVLGRRGLGRRRGGGAGRGGGGRGRLRRRLHPQTAIALHQPPAKRPAVRRRHRSARRWHHQPLRFHHSVTPGRRPQTLPVPAAVRRRLAHAALARPGLPVRPVLVLPAVAGLGVPHQGAVPVAAALPVAAQGHVTERALQPPVGLVSAQARVAQLQPHPAPVARGHGAPAVPRLRGGEAGPAEGGAAGRVPPERNASAQRGEEPAPGQDRDGPAAARRRAGRGNGSKARPGPVPGPEPPQPPPSPLPAHAALPPARPARGRRPGAAVLAPRARHARVWGGGRAGGVPAGQRGGVGAGQDRRGGPLRSGGERADVFESHRLAEDHGGGGGAALGARAAFTGRCRSGKHKSTLKETCQINMQLTFWTESGHCFGLNLLLVTLALIIHIL